MYENNKRKWSTRNKGAITYAMRLICVRKYVCMIETLACFGLSFSRAIIDKFIFNGWCGVCRRIRVLLLLRQRDNIAITIINNLRCSLRFHAHTLYFGSSSIAIRIWSAPFRCIFRQKFNQLLVEEFVQKLGIFVNLRVLLLTINEITI